MGWLWRWRSWRTMSCLIVRSMYVSSNNDKCPWSSAPTTHRNLPTNYPLEGITQSSIETILINSRSLHNLLTLESSQYNSQFMSESHSLTLTHIVRSPLERGCEFCYKEFCAAFTRSDFIISNVERANGSARNFNYAWPGQIVGRIIRKKAQKAEWTAKTFSYARELEIASSTRRIAIEAGNMSEHFAAVNVCRLHTCHAAG